MASSRKKFRFLELPPELRECIYKEAFSDEFVVHGSSHQKVHAPGILLSCKQIYLEAVKTFYRNATFWFWEYDFGVEWYKKLPSMYCEVITKMRYDNQTPESSNRTHCYTAGLSALMKIGDFWDDVERLDQPWPVGTLAVRAVIWWNNKLPGQELYQLWDGERPKRESLPSLEAGHKVVWVSEDAEEIEKALKDSM